MRKKRTTQEFIEIARQVHGDKYDYSQAVYLGGKVRVTLGCPTHGTFLQFADTHLQGHPCRQCSSNALALTLEEFITKARQVHGDKYDYTNTVYVNSRSKLTINCPVHGEFYQASRGHLGGKGCRLCGIVNRSELKKQQSRETFEARAREIHGELYDYSKVAYTTSMTKVELSCKKHGTFLQKPNNHLNGYGCNKCGRESTTKYQTEHPSGWGASDWERGGSKSKNFDAFKVYILKLFNDEECFYKIGRTYTTISERVKSIPYKVSIIHEICNKSAKIIYDLENSLKREYKSYKYVPNKSFRGRHECFIMNLPVNHLIEKYPATLEGEGCVSNFELLTETR